MTDGGSKTICPRYLSVRPAWGTPLLPNTTYAVILAQGITTSDGQPLSADTDFIAMTAGQRPNDPTVAAAWDAYAPLRTYLASDDAVVSAERVIGAAVFTTQPTSQPLVKLRQAIHATAVPAPEAGTLTLCDGANVSPCDDGLAGDAHVRGCFDVDPTVYELHVRVPLAKIQTGTRPYLSPADGGGVEVSPDGTPLLSGTEASVSP